MGQHRVIIVGAGPAAVRCAETLVAAGLRPTVIDENQRDGGQIYRRQAENFTRSYDTLYGTEARNAESLHGAFDALREHIDYQPHTLVWNISEKVVYTVCDSKQASLRFDSLVLCTGATDRLMPVKGWNTAGTYSLGGAQIALKAQACSIGSKVVFMGSGPLLYLAAAQYVKAGAEVAAVLDTSPWYLRVGAILKLLALPAALWNGVILTRTLQGAGVTLYTGVTPLEIDGTSEVGVCGVSFKDGRGKTHDIKCDAVAMGYHLRPETQLADLARCEFEFDSGTRQWLVKADTDGRSSVDGVYVAGDGARILGAAAAETSGKLAAIAILQDQGNAVQSGEAEALRRGKARLQRFAAGIAQAFPWPAQQAAQLPDDAIVCRCESISAGELREAARSTDASELNRAKAFSRVGMGRCQGRYCGNAAAEILAQEIDIPVEQIGRLRGQAPVKPLPVSVAEDADAQSRAAGN